MAGDEREGKKRKKPRWWVRLLINSNPWSKWSYRGYRINKFRKKYKPIKTARAIRKLRKLLKVKRKDMTAMDGKKTYTGIAIVVIGLVMSWLGIGGETEAAELVTAGAQVFGLLVATYGRYVART